MKRGAAWIETPKALIIDKRVGEIETAKASRG